MRDWLILFMIAILFSTLFSTSAIAQAPQVPPASQQIAAAVLPLPEVMREHATVIGYAPDLSPVSLRRGSNGMVCTSFRRAIMSSMCVAIMNPSCRWCAGSAICTPRA